MSDSKEDILMELTECVVQGDVKRAEEMAKKAIEAGVDAYDAITEGLTRGMNVVSDRYEKGEMFLPQVLLSADAMYKGLDVLLPHVKVEGGAKPATVVIGVVEGDVHSIGKDVVKAMLSASGFNVIDLGKDVPNDEFVEAVKKNKADILAMSSLMTTTMPNMGTVIEKLMEDGVRDAVKVIVGGAPITEEFAESINADATRPDASTAAEWAKEIVHELPPAEERWSEEKITLSKVKYREILAKKAPKEDIGRKTAVKIIEEFEKAGVKKKEEMTHAERTIAAIGDKKVDRLPVYPLACGVLRKFVPCTYREYATNPEKFAETAYAGVKYLDLDMFVGLIDLSVTSADLGCKIKFPEEDTPSSEGHLEDYEKIEVPEITENTRVYNLIQSTKLARDRLKELNAPIIGFIEGPLLTLTQLMDAERVLMDMKHNPDVVLKAVEKCTEYVCAATEKFFEEDACDALCVDNLWSNNFIISADDYWKFEGQFVYNKQIPIFKKYNQPYIIHNCADAVHFDIQVGKYGTGVYSYAYYPHEREKGSKNYADLIPEYGDICCFMGEIDPISFLDNSAAGIQKMVGSTKSLMEGVLNTLKESGYQSKYILASGCEIPPGGPLDTVKAMVDTVKEFGPELQKQIMG